MPHTHVTQPSSHKGKGSRKSSSSLSHNQTARGQMERNPVSGARKTFILATSAQPRMQHATCRFCDKKGHFERACLKKKGQGKGKKSKHQYAVDVTRDQDSSEYDDDFDLGAVSINAVENRKSCKVFAPVVFHSKGNSSSSLKVTGKVDTTVLALVFRSHVCCLDLKAVSSVIRSQ